VRRWGREPKPAELGMFRVMCVGALPCYATPGPCLSVFSPPPVPGCLVGPGRERRGVVGSGRGPSGLPSDRRAITTPRRWSRSRGRPPAWAASCATFFTMGADRLPCSMPSFWPPLDDPRQRCLIEGRGPAFAHYGNCVGRYHRGRRSGLRFPATRQPLGERPMAPGADGNEGDRLRRGGRVGKFRVVYVAAPPAADWHGSGPLCLGAAQRRPL